MEDFIAKWAEDNQFNEEGYTYIVKGDSYSIKEELKAAGFKFSKPLGWHRKTNEGYEDKTVAIHMNDVYEFYNWGGFSVKAEAAARIRILTQPQEVKPTFFYGTIGETVKEMKCTLTKIGGYNGNFGHSFIYTFENDCGNVFVWFTTVNLALLAGDTVVLNGRIKDYKEYFETKQTILSRCKVTKC